MRKLLIPAIAAAMVIAVAGIAYAANVYTVDGDTQPRAKGSAKKPVPESLDFSYTVADEVQANRGIPVKSYFIGAEGLMTYPRAFPSCSGGTSGANAPDLATANRACKKAKVGGGTIKALVGARNAPTTSSNCVLNLTLYNLKPGNYGDAGKKQKVGFYSAVGCKGGKRSIQVTFVSETGQRSPVTKDKKC